MRKAVMKVKDISVMKRDSPASKGMGWCPPLSSKNIPNTIGNRIVNAIARDNRKTMIKYCLTGLLVMMISNQVVHKATSIVFIEGNLPKIQKE